MSRAFLIQLTNNTHVMNRNYTLDVTRTIAIALMVIFHFIYDLTFFGWLDWDLPDGDGWRHFRWLIISLFFVCLGVSLTFAHRHSFRSRKFLIRFSQIAAGGLAISIATYIAIPENWIFFGVLHFLALASLICIPFVRFAKLSLALGLLIIAIGISGAVESRWPFDALFTGKLPAYTNDYVAIFPWLGLVFLGIFLGHSKWFIADPLKQLQGLPSQTLLIWPGQHSLSIYLLHQPLILGGMYLVSLFL
jgi:uncharacterized membrane protein